MPESNQSASARPTRRQMMALVGAGSALGVAGCAAVFDDDDPTEPEVPDDPDEIPMDGEFVGSVGANPSTFDPSIIADASSNAVIGTLAYEALIDLEFSFEEFRPALATDWEQVDETTWRFEIREGVEFHNGEELTAEDVNFSVQRMRGTVNDATVDWYEDHEIVDEFTIEFETQQPHAPMQTDIAGVPIVPSGVDGVSEEPQEDDHPFDEESIGTGPFILDEFAPEDRVELVRNEEYWWDGEEFPEMAPWETVTFQVVPEQVSQQEAILAGELDMIDNPAPFELDIFDGEDPEPIIGNAVGFDFISFPVQASPYDNENFRRGITRLIPREEIIEAIFGGNATALGGPISPGLATYWDDAHEQELLDEYVGEDREAAEELLDQAFEEEDIEQPFELNLITNVNRTRERWMEVIQQTLDDTEYFDAGLDIQDFDALVPFLTGGDAAESTDIVGIGWTGGSDPNGHVESILHSDFHVPDGFNWNLYANEEVDQLIDQGQTTVDEDEREDVYRELQEVLAEDVPEAFMWNGDQIDVVRPDAVENWLPYPNSSNRYWALYRPTVDQVSWEP